MDRRDSLTATPPVAYLRTTVRLERRLSEELSFEAQTTHRAKDDEQQAADAAVLANESSFDVVRHETPAERYEREARRARSAPRSRLASGVFRPQPVGQRATQSLTQTLAALDDDCSAADVRRALAERTRGRLHRPQRHQGLRQLVQAVDSSPANEDQKAPKT